MTAIQLNQFAGVANTNGAVSSVSNPYNGLTLIDQSNSILKPGHSYVITLSIVAPLQTEVSHDTTIITSEHSEASELNEGSNQSNSDQ